MPLGGATKKIQKLLDTAEELYNRIVELREQVMEVRETVQETNERVAGLENRLDQQGAILEALAEHEDIDVDELVAEVAIEEAEPTEGAEPAEGDERDEQNRQDDGTGPETAADGSAVPDAEAGNED